MGRFYRRRRHRHLRITDPRLDITATDAVLDGAALALTRDHLAREHLAPPERPRRWKPWYWAVAAALHVVAIALLLILTRPRQQQEALEPSGVSVVYEPGASQTVTPRQSDETAPALPPPPPTAPPPPQVAEAAPEVNLNLPQDLFSPLTQAPQVPQPPAPETGTAPRARSHALTRMARRPSQKYTVMNNMSLGRGPTSLSPTGQRGLDMSLPQSDAQAVMAPQVTIQGQYGADWGAAFNKWVYAHLYYPDAAAAQGQQGYVTVTFTAHRDGSVTGLHLVSGSGSNFLDLAWQGIFLQNQLPKFPPGGSDTVQITATVHYELTP